MAVYLLNYSYLSCFIAYAFYFSTYKKIMLFYMVTRVLLESSWKLRYEYFGRYTPLIVLYLSLISHVFINIHEK